MHNKIKEISYQKGSAMEIGSQGYMCHIMMHIKLQAGALVGVEDCYSATTSYPITE
jgi:hypothetical protein